VAERPEQDRAEAETRAEVMVVATEAGLVAGSEAAKAAGGRAAVARGP
jgi:hypothetical protein